MGRLTSKVIAWNRLNLEPPDLVQCTARRVLHAPKVSRNNFCPWFLDLADFSTSSQWTNHKISSVNTLHCTVEETVLLYWGMDRKSYTRTRYMFTSGVWDQPLTHFAGETPPVDGTWKIPPLYRQFVLCQLRCPVNYLNRSCGQRYRWTMVQ